MSEHWNAQMLELRGDEGLRVCWEDLGEGWGGDFDPSDPEDEALLRFTVFDGDEQLDNASYCTRLPVGTDPEQLRRGAQLVLDAVREAHQAGASIKRPLEELSWMALDEHGRLA